MHVTASLLASNITGAEEYAEVLVAGHPADSDGVADWLLPALDSLAEDFTIAIMREVEEYAKPGDDEAARAVRRVARDAVAGFAARVTRPAPTAPTAATAATAAAETAGPPETASAASMFRDLGRLLAMEGRSLNALRAALRVGASVTWQRLQEQARQGNGNPEAFARIGEIVFWYLDELTASCSAGYAEARAELAGETSQLRRRLLDLLISSPAAPGPAIASLAVPLADASGTLRWAVQALALARRGLIRHGVDGSGAKASGAVASGTVASDGVVWCEDHLPTLVLLADTDLAAALSREALALLASQRPAPAGHNGS